MRQCFSPTVVSASRRSLPILLAVELTTVKSKEVVILPCRESYPMLVKKHAKFDERHYDIKLRKLVVEFGLNSINDFKVRCFQI